jgi:hypothetical protein
MAFNVKQLRNGFTAKSGITSTIVRRPFRISGLPTGLGQDGAQIFPPPFPQLGDPDQLFPEAICIDQVLDRIVRVEGTDDEGNTGTIAHGHAVFKSNNPFTGGPSPISGLIRDDFVEHVPVFELVAEGAYVARRLAVLRPRAARVERRILNGVPISDIQDAILSAVGCLFDFNGLTVMFAGARARAVNNRIDVSYTFTVNGPLPAIPIGTIQGSDVDIPACPALGTYRTFTSGGVPVVAVVDVASIHPVCGFEALPGL